MSTLTLSEQATKQQTTTAILPMLMSTLQPCILILFDNPLISPQPAPKRLSGQKTTYYGLLPTAEFSHEEAGWALNPRFDNLSNVAWPSEPPSFSLDDAMNLGLVSIYIAAIAGSIDSFSVPLYGAISVHPSPSKLSYALPKSAIYVSSPWEDHILSYGPRRTLDADIENMKQADQSLSALQDKLAQISQLPAGAICDESQAFDPLTIDTCRGLIRTLSGYLMRSERVNDSPFLVPSSDGSVLFKWLSREKELSITIEQAQLQVQRWSPLSAYESEGYWEISLDQVGEQFDWLIQ